MKKLEQLLARLTDVASLSDAELESIRTQLRGLVDEVPEDANDDDLATLERIAEAIGTVKGEQESRRAQADDRAAKRQALIDRMSEGDPDDDEDDGGEAGAESEGGEADVTPVVVEAEKVPEPVAAAAAPKITRQAVRRPKSMAPAERKVDVMEWGLVASANVPGLQPGERLDSPEKLGRAFEAAIRSMAGYRNGPRQKVSLARSGSDNPADLYPAERILTRDARSNWAKIDSATSYEAVTAAPITASGGIGVPTPVRYDLPVLPHSDARPVRDTMLNRFGVERGGITLLPPPVLADVDGAVDEWTEANDQNPADPATKPCLVVEAPGEEQTTLVDAITRCLQYGNFRARFFAEQITAWMNLTGASYARFTETRLLNAIATGSTQVTTGQNLGAMRDLLAVLDRGTAAFRSYYRLPASFPLRFGAPYWLLNLLRTDLARELPGSQAERLAVADASIEGFIRARGVNVSWFLDGEAGQVFGKQGDGPLQGWPPTVITYLYPEGSWLYLDGGTLDLGVVRDATLNSTNDVQVFAEGFENIAFHGVESWRIAMDLCPNGGTAATIEVEPCDTGS